MEQSMLSNRTAMDDECFARQLECVCCGEGLFSARCVRSQMRGDRCSCFYYYETWSPIPEAVHPRSMILNMKEDTKYGLNMG